jgi:hypothetical protein
MPTASAAGSSRSPCASICTTLTSELAASPFHTPGVSEVSARPTGNGRGNEPIAERDAAQPGGESRLTESRRDWRLEIIIRVSGVRVPPPLSPDQADLVATFGRVLLGWERKWESATIGVGSARAQETSAQRTGMAPAICASHKLAARSSTARRKWRAPPPRPWAPPGPGDWPRTGPGPICGKSEPGMANRGGPSSRPTRPLRIQRDGMRINPACDSRGCGRCR